MKTRLDQYLASRQLVASRSQAESYIKMGSVKVNGRVVTKSGYSISENDKIELTQVEQYVSRAGLKLAGVAKSLNLNFEGKTVLDVGSSTGGFTDYALRNGAKKVIAVDVGTNQLHPSLHGDERIELHEKTDIRDFNPEQAIDVVVIDVSFISLRQILPHISDIVTHHAVVVPMVKPQFEASKSQINKGVIKNSAIRRSILKEFEEWVKKYFIIQAQADSQVAGEKGNVERFYSMISL